MTTQSRGMEFTLESPMWPWYKHWGLTEEYETWGSEDRDEKASSGQRAFGDVMANCNLQDLLWYAGKLGIEDGIIPLLCDFIDREVSELSSEVLEYPEVREVQQTVKFIRRYAALTDYNSQMNPLQLGKHPGFLWVTARNAQVVFNSVGRRVNLSWYSLYRASVMLIAAAADLKHAIYVVQHIDAHLHDTKNKNSIAETRAWQLAEARKVLPVSRLFGYAQPRSVALPEFQTISGENQ